MSPKSATLFKVLLNRFHAGLGESFLKSLPQTEVKEIFGQKISSENPVLALDWSRDLLGRVHYSWLAPVLVQMPQELHHSVVASLPQKQSAGLRKLLNLGQVPNDLSAVAKSFLVDQFCRQWGLEWVTPQAYMPETSMSPILTLTKGELVLLIDYLALYDVAEAVRHIVDKNKLKTIYKCLSEREQQFLRICLHKKERITAPVLDIEKWDGDPEKLRFILHRRGMFRFSKAISGQSKEFLWHLVHTLDTGRGKAIQERYEEKEVAGITPVLIQQVKSVIDFIKQKSDT